MLFFTILLNADNTFHIGAFGGWNGFKAVIKDAKDNASAEEKAMIKAKQDVSKMQNTGIFGAEFGYRFKISGKFFIDPTLSVGYSQKTNNVTDIVVSMLNNMPPAQKRAMVLEDVSGIKSLKEGAEFFQSLPPRIKGSSAGQRVLDILQTFGKGAEAAAQSRQPFDGGRYIQEIERVIKDPREVPNADIDAIVQARANTITRTDIKTKLIPIHLVLKAGYEITDSFSAYGIAGGGVSIVKEGDEKAEVRGDITAGAGVSFSFTKNLSAFAEYRYTRTFMKDTDTDRAKAINSNRVVGGLQFNF